MKILFWTDGFWPRIGGIETQSLQFIKGLQEKGHQCVIIAQKDDPSQKDHETYEGILIQRFDLNRIIPAKELKSLHLIENYLNWIIQEFQIDIVHLNTCLGWSAFIFSIFRNKFSVPIILTVHAPYYYQNENTSIASKIYPQVDLICCVSMWVADELKRLESIHDNRLRLVYNGLPLSQVSPLPISFSPPTLLLLGRLTIEKGFDTAIEAFSLLKKEGSDAQLIIAGDGTERAVLENLVEKLDLWNSVEFVGPLTQELVPHFLNKATMVVVPSYTESFGLVALEAMQMQRPVVASCVGGLKELISHGENGLLVEPHKPDILCKAIQEVLRCPKKAQEMGLKGRKRATEKFTLQQNVTQYENLYKELIGQS